MRSRKTLSFAFAFSAALLSQVSPGNAAEYAFTAYPLGSLSFGAGVIPPPATYVTNEVALYSGKIGGNFDFGGRVFNAGAKVDIFSDAVNVLYVPSTKILDGHLGISLSVPADYLAVAAKASGPLATVAAETEGGGMGDLVYSVQLGWDIGDFSHNFHVQGVAPTGRYETGFFPINGLNRPSFDVGWAFTWLEKTTQLQFNGAFGFMFSIENEALQYQTGNEFHFEWAIGHTFKNGLEIGVVGYDYRQLTGDSGQGARFPFIGTVDAIGAGLTYTTKIGETPVTFSARNYEEYNTENRFKGNLTIGSITAGF